MKTVAAMFCLLALAGCQAQVSETATVSQSQLEKQVAGLYTPDDPKATVVAACLGQLAARVDATQDCHLVIGKQEADVRVKVTEVAGTRTKFAPTPYVPAARVATTIKKALKKQGYQIDLVRCESELLGIVGEKTFCQVSPADSEGKVRAKVTSVEGLLVNFDYKVLG